MMPIPIIAPWELVYMYTARLSDGATQRRLLWHDFGQIHSATLPEARARAMGLDIAPDTAFCGVWVVVESVIILALAESLSL